MNGKTVLFAEVVSVSSTCACWGTPIRIGPLCPREGMQCDG